MIEVELVAVTEKMDAMDKHLAALATRIRVLQVIVIGGWFLDFFVKNAPKAQAMTLAFFGGR